MFVTRLTNGNDSWTSNALGNGIIIGLRGDDVMYAYGLGDRTFTCRGGKGNDIFGNDGFGGQMDCFGGAGDDTAYIGGNASFHGGSGVNTVFYHSGALVKIYAGHGITDINLDGSLNPVGEMFIYGDGPEDVVIANNFDKVTAIDEHTFEATTDEGGDLFIYFEHVVDPALFAGTSVAHVDGAFIH